MTENHPITPPPELVQLLRREAPHGIGDAGVTRELFLITAAYRAGADDELEACCEWLGDAPVVYNDNGELHPGAYLRDARRPKPPSLKERAMSELACSVAGGNITPERGAIIRLALEQLPND